MTTYKKKISDGIGFASKINYEYDNKKFEADIKDGDKVKLLNAGVETQGNWGMQTNFNVKTRNGDKKVAFNQSTINVLVDEYGSEGEVWIGKELNVILKKTLINGKKVVASYFVPNGYGLDEYGAIVKLGQTSDKAKIEDKEEIPVTSEQEELQNINPEDIPF